MIVRRIPIRRQSRRSKALADVEFSLWFASKRQVRAGLFALALLVPALLAPARAEAPDRLPAPAAPAGSLRGPARQRPPTLPAGSLRPLPGGAGSRRRAQTKNMRVVYLGKEYPEPLPLSYAEKPITDKGIQGARLMLKEANQAGNFVGHSFELIEAIVPEDGDVVAKAKEVLASGERFIIADLEPADLLAVADLPEAKDAVIMNIRSSATALRQEDCRINVFHVIPDYAMRADALAQYLIWKKWPRWFVIRRDTPEDQDYLARSSAPPPASAARWSSDKVYDLPPGARNLDSGHQQIQAQIPMETEEAPDHDVVWVINSDDDFGDYLMYRTYLPRPVVGTQGLQAMSWDKSYTESGAMHFQNAIPRLAKRPPVERDYTAWLGFRALADSAMKSGKTSPAEVKAYMLSPVQARRLQGPGHELPHLGPSDAPADRARRRHPRSGFDFAAGGLPASHQRHRHAWLRQPETKCKFK